MESSEVLSVSLITISIVGSSNPENDNVRGGPLLTPERRERRECQGNQVVLFNKLPTKKRKPNGPSPGTIHSQPPWCILETFRQTFGLLE